MSEFYIFLSNNHVVAAFLELAVFCPCIRFVFLFLIPGVFSAFCLPFCFLAFGLKLLLSF